MLPAEQAAEQAVVQVWRGQLNQRALLFNALGT